MDNLEEFIKKTKQMHKDLDKELDELAEEEGIGKDDAKGEAGGDNDSIDLNQLETEDDKLAEEEAELEKQANAPEEVDEWPEELEKFYHKNEIFKSMTVMEMESGNLEKVIDFKKKYDIEYDFFELKLSQLKAQMLKLTNLIEAGVIDMDKYKEGLNKELEYEQKLLKHCETDKKVTNLSFLKKRLEKRIELINAELQEEVEVENDQEQAAEQATAVEETEPTKDSQVQKANDQKLLVENVEKELDKASVVTGITVTTKTTADTETKAEVKPIEYDTELYDRLIKRGEEYKEARDYFIKYNFTERAEEAKQSAVKLLLSCQKLKKGEKVNELDLPYDITPDFICGLNKKDRINAFMVILRDFTARKKDGAVKLETLKKKFSQLNKRELQKNQDQIQKVLTDITNKCNKYDGVVQKLTEMVKDEWTPVPEYVMEDEEEKELKINEDIPENIVHITIKKTNYDKKDVYLHVKIQFSDEKAPIEEYVYFKQHLVYDHKIILKLDSSEFKKIFKKKIEIQLYRYHWYWPFKPSHKGSCLIDLTPLKATADYEKSYDIDLVSKRCVPKLDIHIQARTPCQEKEYTTTTKQIVSITKSYPSFRSYKNVPAELVQQPKPAVNVDIVDKPKQAKVVPGGAEVKKEPQTKSAEPVQNVDKDQFCEEELKDPDFVEILTSLEYLKVLTKNLEDQSNKIEGRLPREFREKLMKTRVKKNAMQKSLEEGIIDQQSYLTKLADQIKHDKQLLLYFKQINDPKKEGIVKQRLEISIKEFEKIKK